MNKNNVIKIIIAFLALALIVFVVYFMKSDVVEQVVGNIISSSDFDDNNNSYNTETATYITLNGSDVTVDNGVAKVEKNSITLQAEGIYVFTGNYTGTIKVESKANIRIVLNGVTINSEDGPAIYVLNAKKTIITVVENTTNTLTDTTKYSDEESTATIYSKDDIVFNGTGTLNVEGNYQDGIVGKDDLKIVSGVYNIKAMNNALKGKDSVEIVDGEFTLDAENDSIKSTNDEDTAKGYIVIHNGIFNITAGHDGIQAETTLTIENGTFDIVSGDGSSSSNVSASSNNDMFFMRGQWGQQTTTEEDTGSFKGIKASGNIIIQNGTFTIDSADDAIHSDSDITIKNGNIKIDSGDDGIHADGMLQIDNGTIDITAHEGIEATYVKINDGTITISATDDGINAGNKSSAYDTTIEINGGNITIKMGSGDTDGIDSNGNIYINGGTIDITGNSPFDYDGEAKYNGGTIIVNGTGTNSITNQFGGQMGVQQGGIMNNMQQGQIPQGDQQMNQGIMQQGQRGR